MTADTTVRDYLHGLALDSETIEAFLNALTRLSVHSLSGPDEEILCGITLLREKKAGTVASSSEAAQVMDEIQYDYNDGPCLSASREQNTVHVVDLHDESRWPAYAKEVAGRGVRSILAVPFILESGDRAALNLYSEKPDDFDAGDISKAQEYASQASQALSLSVRLSGHRDTRGGPESGDEDTDDH
ncbi:GAF domain-containing protein [Arthrobacter sp. H14]|uniref:GAF domain-containing protein n=1 Tax=Arthrobacter sp. H14 TaxID=1312959 RepID=UPI0004B8B779|nr:GAF domain-containing protein [Arthrobacter sp. H14]